MHIPIQKKSKAPDGSSNDLRPQGSAAPNLPPRREQQRHRLPPRIQTPAIIQRRTNFAFPGPGRRQGNQRFQSSPDVLLPKSGRRGIDKRQCSLRPSGCGLPLCSIIQKGWGWLGLGRRCRQNPEDMHRPPPPPPFPHQPIPSPPVLYVRDIAMSHAMCVPPSIMYGTCQTYRRREWYAIRGGSSTYCPVCSLASSSAHKSSSSPGSIRHGPALQLAVTPGCTYSVCDRVDSRYSGRGKGEKGGVTFRGCPPPPR